MKPQKQKNQQAQLTFSTKPLLQSSLKPQNLPANLSRLSNYSSFKAQNDQYQIHKREMLVTQSINNFSPSNLKDTTSPLRLSQALKSPRMLQKENFDIPNSKQQLGNAAMNLLTVKEYTKSMVQEKGSISNMKIKKKIPKQLSKSQNELLDLLKLTEQMPQNTYRPNIVVKSPRENLRKGSVRDQEPKEVYNYPCVLEFTPKRKGSFLSQISQKNVIENQQKSTVENDLKIPSPSGFCSTPKKRKHQVGQEQDTPYKINQNINNPEDLQIKESSNQTNFTQNQLQLSRSSHRQKISEVRESSLITPTGQNKIIKEAKNANSEFIISTGFYSKPGKSQGYPKINQDRALVNPQFQKGFSLFAVSDGHGANGHEVSQFVVENIPIILENDNNLQWRPQKSFQSLNEQLIKKLVKTKIPSNKSGATLVTVGIKLQVKESVLFCCNAGDSRAILLKKQGAYDWIVEQLSTDHKPSSYEEKIRIHKCGGYVAPMTDERGNEHGPDRIWSMNDRWPGLSTSRSIGDTDAHQLGVTYEPSLFSLELKEEDKVIVIGSDGLFEFLTNNDIKFFVKQWIAKNVLDANIIARDLVKTARKRWKQVTLQYLGQSQVY